MKESVLIYDDHCSLCKWYSALFVKWGILAPSARIGYSQIDNTLLKNIDVERANNEIPLLNTKTLQVWYGVDALVEVLNNKLPFVKPIALFKPIHWMLKKLYKLISYNRKSIAANVPPANTITCEPSYSFNYKKMFIVLCFTFAVILGNLFYKIFFANLVEFFTITSGLLVLTGVFIVSKKWLEIICQWQLQLLVMSVVLLPAYWLYAFSGTASILYVCIALFLFAKQIVHRIQFLKYYFSTIDNNTL